MNTNVLLVINSEWFLLMHPNNIDAIRLLTTKILSPTESVSSSDAMLPGSILLI